MPTALVSTPFVARFGDELKAVAKRAGKAVDFMTPPEKEGARLTQADCDRIDCTFIDHSIRLDDQLYAAYSEAVLNSNSLKWIHLWASGVTHIPFVIPLAEKSVMVTSSTGANAEPVAQTGFTGLLMLARKFPHYIEGQHKHEWRPLRGAALPDDLRGQTVVIIGVGAIGKIFAAYAYRQLRSLATRRAYV